MTWKTITYGITIFLSFSTSLLLLYERAKSSNASGNLHLNKKDTGVLVNSDIHHEFKPGHSRSRVIFYNRLGKCGSRSLISIATSLSKRNNFNILESTDYGNMRPPHDQVVTEILKISKLQPPTFYHRHIHYLDFEKYDFKKPIYMNIIRDPIARFASEYNYEKYGDGMRRVNSTLKNMPDINVCVIQNHERCHEAYYTFYIGRYFCGFDEQCRTTSEKSVEIAKRNIDEKYEVVGSLEEFENTLILLEKMLPEYFKGARDSWKESSSAKERTKTMTSDFLNVRSKFLLRTRYLKAEYDVYIHAKAKFETLKRRYGMVDEKYEIYN